MWYVCKECDKPKQAAPYGNNMTKSFLCEKCRDKGTVVETQTLVLTKQERFAQAFQVRVAKR